jgi:predicted secreted protein
MAIIVEAVRLLEENRRLSRDLAERTELLKMKYLVDKEMRHRVENELMKTIIEDLEVARNTIGSQAQEIQ